MKIINDLADGAVKDNKKDSFAIKISILLAVILLGTVVFIVGSLKHDMDLVRGGSTKREISIYW